MPACAAASRPSRSRVASVNAPRTWPNSSSSISASGIAAQLTTTNGASRRGDELWIVRATSSLPVPLSPKIATVASVVATIAMRS